MRHQRRFSLPALPIMLLALLGALAAGASSHREAPAILSSPQVDSTDFYMFRSYEPGRSGFVTLIANYNPLQDPYGGPNYFPLDSDAVYDLHVTNDGDAVEDLTFRFRFGQQSKNIALQIGDAGAEETVAVPLVNVGPIGPATGLSLSNENRFFTLEVIRGPVDTPSSAALVVNPRRGDGLFGLPLDHIGDKSFEDYESYARSYIHDVDIPDCGGARVFAGQRQESFAVNLGEVFDLVNLDPVGPPDAETSDTEDKNITSLILELPIDCLTDASTVIGGWTSASQPRHRTLIEDPTYDHRSIMSGAPVQVSRLANPLVNEVAIGIPDKNLFNASHPRSDAQFLTYVTHPTLPELLEVLFGVTAPNAFPRADLVEIFLTGVTGLNQDGSVAELMRLNTAIEPTPRDAQDRLGVIGGDLAGYPNGRRPGDDAVDISLRAVMGVLLDATVAPSGQLPYTDGAIQNAQQFQNRFPYLQPPRPGSPNQAP